MTTKESVALLTINQASVLLARSHWTIRRDIVAGRLGSVRIGRRVYIEPIEVERLIEAGRSKASERTVREAGGER